MPIETISNIFLVPIKNLNISIFAKQKKTEKEMQGFIESLSQLGGLLHILITAAVTWAGSFLFYGQRKESLKIENESKQSEEWRKLYLESQNDSRKKDEKIDELYRNQSRQDSHIIDLERRINLISIYRCDRINCTQRIGMKVNELPPSDDLPSTPD